MNRHLVNALAALAWGTLSSLAFANDIEGTITQIDVDRRTLTVQGITFHTTASTDYDDGLERFEDLRVDQKVEVDFEYREGRHIATEIDLED